MLPENVYQIFYDQCAYDIPFLLYKRTQAPKLHKLRGRRLDHEQHEMSENRETTNAAMYPAILHLAGISPHSTTLRAGSGRAE
jgi:hypothetical protein